MAASEGTDRLVIGIDFGTTFSGVAAVYSAIPEAPDEISVIKTWPGGSNLTSDKVPSVIAYGPSAARTSVTPSTPTIGSSSFFASMFSGGTGDPGERRRWGFQLRPEESRLQCMKLLLDDRQRLPGFFSPSTLKDQLKSSGKSVHTVVADYLTLLWKHAKMELERRFGSYFLSHTKLEVVLTVPAVWSDAAKDATLRAARRAGMGDDLALISEPEAAAVYTLKAIQPNHLRQGNNFIVCDAGGGTVDLVSYEISQVSPLRIQESVEGSGGCCGAVILNMRFEEHVRAIVGAPRFDALRRDNPPSWQTALKYFEDYVKRNFDPEDDDTHFHVPFPGIGSDVPGINYGFLTLSSADVRSIFLPVIEEIVQLIESQMHRLEVLRKPINGVVLVGGFGQSNCLFKTLQARFHHLSPPPPYPGTSPTEDQHRFEIMQPVNAWTAVVRGAVLRGLEGSDLVLSRKSRRHYGVRHSTTFDATKHGEDRKYWDTITETWKAENALTWYIFKGQTCVSHRPIMFPFLTNMVMTSSKLHTVHLVVSDEDVAPDAYDGGWNGAARILCSMTIDLNDVPDRYFSLMTNASGLNYRRLDYKLGMQIESGGIRFDLRVDDTAYGTVVASFE